MGLTYHKKAARAGAPRRGRVAAKAWGRPPAPPYGVGGRGKETRPRLA